MELGAHRTASPREAISSEDRVWLASKIRGDQRFWISSVSGAMEFAGFVGNVIGIDN
jgi:hypothetical protein